jgi:hypothetical protein
MDVTPMSDPRIFVIPNCTIEQISLGTYEEFLLGYDNLIADGKIQPMIVVFPNGNASVTADAAATPPGEGLGAHGEYVTRPEDFLPALDRCYKLQFPRAFPLSSTARGRRSST